MITKIVLTGGPCAGKTTALARVVDHFSNMGFQVFTVPDAAKMFAQSGIDFMIDDKALFLESERQLMEFQIELEDRFERIAEHIDRPVLIVCDRGTMDLRAYLKEDMWESLLDAMGMSVVALRDARYAAVIHMATAAKGAERFYTLANNAARAETPELARDIDDRLMRAWTGHPHLRVIGNDCTLDEKMNRVLKEISHVLGVPQPIEIERKYLVDVIAEIPNGNVCEIRQTYLKPVDGLERRLRMRGENCHNVYFLTTKKRLAVDRSYEYESRISKDQYNHLIQEANPAKRTIVKHRCCFLWENQYFELDEFKEPRLEHHLLEIEDAENAAAVKIPPFVKVIKDVTGDPNYSNSNIAKI